MNLTLQLKMAKRKGEATAKELGFASLPIDPIAIASACDIEVRAKPNSDSGVSGMLLRHGDKFGILYATHIPSRGFQRFSISHELGHYFLDGHIDHVLPEDGAHTSHAGYVSKDPYEQEADNFAAGLLLPERPFQKAIGRFEPGLAAIEGLQDLSRASLTATAIRYAELTEDATAVVVSSGSTIDYCILSEPMKGLKEISWLKKGSPVPAGTATSKMNVSPSRVEKGDREDGEIDIMDWFGGQQSIPAFEQVVGLGSYGKTLTVLSCPRIVDDTYRDEDDDEDDDDLEERWTPRFRR